MTDLNFPPTILDNFKAELLATVFDQGHIKLAIMQKSKRLYNAQTTKYGKPTPSYDSSSQILNKEVDLPEELLNDIRMDKELEHLRNIYKIAFEEVMQTNTITSGQIQAAIEALQQDNGAFGNICKELKANGAKLKELQDQLVKEREVGECILKDKCERIRNLRHELLNMQLVHRVEVNLIEKWSDNRNTQAEIVNEQQQRLLMQQLLFYKRSLATEQRLICEVLSFRKNESFQLNENIRQWRIKYKIEHERVSAENQKITNKIKDIKQQNEHYQQLHREQIVFMEEYFIRKAEEKRLYEEQCYKIQCIIRLQAWWRGIMVRHGLGPYRKKAKKSKKTKAKK